MPSTGAAAVGVVSIASPPQLLAEITIPTSSNPQGITEGPDDNMWFTESAAGAIGVVNVNSLTDPSQDTLGIPIPIPTNGQTGGVVSNPDPQGIITDTADNSLWFADSAGAVGVVNMNTALAVTTEPPTFVTPNGQFGLTVTIEDSDSNVVDRAFNGTVTVGLDQNPGGSTLGGTKTATATRGVATFSGLTLNNLSNGYTLQVSASGFPTVETGAVNVVPAVYPTLANLGFQTPYVGTGSSGAYQYRPAGSPWTFSGGAGLAGNGSAFTAGNPSPPVGTQVAFLQKNGQFSQSVTLGAGTYTISVVAAQRAIGQSSSQTFEVSLDGTPEGTFTPSGTSYTTLTTGDFTASGEAVHALSLLA